VTDCARWSTVTHRKDILVTKLISLSLSHTHTHHTRFIRNSKTSHVATERKNLNSWATATAQTPKTGEISHYANTAAFTCELAVEKTYGWSKGNSAWGLSDRNMSTLHRNSYRNKRHSWKRFIHPRTCRGKHLHLHSPRKSPVRTGLPGMFLCHSVAALRYINYSLPSNNLQMIQHAANRTETALSRTRSSNMFSHTHQSTGPLGNAAYCWSMTSTLAVVSRKYLWLITNAFNFGIHWAEMQLCHADEVNSLFSLIFDLVGPVRKADSTRALKMRRLKR
jgi:hypothetical protein